MLKGASFFAACMQKRGAAALILLIFLCVQQPIEANKIPGFCAFSSVSSLDSTITGTRYWFAVQPNRISALPYTDSRSSHVSLFMAAPGKSDELARKERDEEIRAKIAKLKSQGKMNKGESAEDSAMLEAEAFFNKPSPMKKFQERAAERERLALLEAEAEKLRNEDGVE